VPVKPDLDGAGAHADIALAVTTLTGADRLASSGVFDAL
jgi:hypothetical protein